MKNLANKIPFVVFIISIIAITFSCKKNSIEADKVLSSEEILIKINNDPDFKNYILNLNLLVEKTFEVNSKDLVINTASSNNKMSEQRFLTLFKKSIENDFTAKNEISNFMGFNRPYQFWYIRTALNSSLSNLIKKYDFKKITRAQWYELVKGINRKNTSQSQSSSKSFMLNPDNCIEQYRDCVDDANAQYAVEALGCVGWGALGWTIVGGVLFVGCEGLSYYHLSTMKRKCESSYKSCK